MITKRRLTDLNLILSNKDGVHYIRHKDEEDTLKDLVGLEIESNFTPFSNVLRDVIKQLQHPDVGILPRHITGRTVVLKALGTYIIPDITNICYPNPVFDGGGVELITYPMTETAMYRSKSEFLLILETLAKYGFNPVIGKDGVHLNIDKTLFGYSIKEVRDSFSKMLLFLYNEPDLMIFLSGRKAVDSKLADLYWMLGDMYGNLSEENLKQVFYEQKGLLLDSLSSGEDIKAFNIHSNKEGRPSVEIGWFGSTHNYDQFMSYIDIAFYFPKYFRQANYTQCNFKGMFDHIKKYNIKYKYLYDRLSKYFTYFLTKQNKSNEEKTLKKTLFKRRNP